MSGLEKLKVPQLQGLCKSLHLPASGKKADIIARLELHPSLKPPQTNCTQVLSAHQQAIADLVAECSSESGM